MGEKAFCRLEEESRGTAPGVSQEASLEKYRDGWRMVRRAWAGMVRAGGIRIFFTHHHSFSLMQIRWAMETLTGMAFVTIGLVILLINILSSLLIPGEGSGVIPDIWGTLLLVVLSLGFLEGGASIFRQSRGGGISQQDHPSSLSGVLSGLAGSVKQVVVFTSLALIFAIIVLPDLVSRPLAISSRFIFLVLLYSGYALVVRPLAIPRIRRLGTALERLSLHHYTLTPTGLVIDYRMTNPRDPEKKYRFTVSFDEVMDLRLLLPDEASAKAYDLHAGYEESKQLQMFITGEISRPSLILQPSDEYLSLFLEGSGFTYIMAFDNDDPTEVIRAFQASRTGGGAPSPAPER